MKDVILLGASGLAREVIAAAGDRFRVVGILDDNPELHGSRIDGVGVLGPVHDAVRVRTPLLICVGTGRGRHAIADRLAAFDVGEDRFGTFVDASVRIPPGCTVKPGSIVLAGVVLTAMVRIGRHCVVMPNVTLTHDDALGDFVTVAAGASLGGGVTVGEGAYLGMNASVRQGVHVGAGAIVGMGAAVVADVPAGETWVGVPARSLYQRSAV